MGTAAGMAYGTGEARLMEQGARIMEQGGTDYGTGGHGLWNRWVQLMKQVGTALRAKFRERLVWLRSGSRKDSRLAWPRNRCAWLGNMWALLENRWA
jgi:hypothetical protein